MKARLRLLGGLEASGPAATAVDIPSRKVRALLAYLACPPGRAHERDALAALLWGDTPDEHARHSLRQALSVLRRALPDALVLGERLALDADAVESDAAEFERLARAGDARSLEAAAQLWAGDLLEGFAVDAEPFEDWLRAERVRLHDLAVDALGKLLSLRVRAGADGEALQLAHRLLALDPGLESAHRTVMRLYERAGRRAAALRHYQLLVATLRRDYGTRPEPETVELHGRLLRRTAPDAPGAAPASEPDPLIERERELAAITSGIERALAGQGASLAILGEAGAGKSRMIEELEHRWLGRGGRVLSGRAHSIERGLPFAAWAEALRGGLTHAEMAAIGAPHSHLARLLPELGAAAGRVDGGGQGRAALVDAVVRLIARLAAECPVLIALEDLHWTDPATVELVGQVARQRGPVLVAFTARDDELLDAPAVDALVRELGHERHLDRVALRPLSRQGAEAVVRGRLGAAAAAADVAHVADAAWRGSQGNPLFVVEVVRAAQEGRLPPAGAPPGPVQEILAARLGRLSPGARRLCELAAVIGRDFDLGLIRRAARAPAREAAALLDELGRRRILRAVGPRYEFAHALHRDTVLAGLAPIAVAGLHAAVARALAAQPGPRTPDVVRGLAEHHARAGSTAKAVECLALHADYSLRTFAAGEAIAALEDALDKVAALPAGRGRRRLDLLLRLAPALAMAGRFAEILDRLLPERGMVDRLGDPALAADYHFRIALTHTVLENVGAAVRAGELALDAATRAGTPALLGRARFVLAALALAAGQPRTGLGHARESARLLADTDDRSWLVLARWIQGLHHLMVGELDEARTAETASIAAAADDPGLASYGEVILAWVELERGDLDAAVVACHGVLDSPGEPANLAAAQGFLGMAWLARDDAARALAQLEQATRRLARLPTRYQVFLVPLAEACLALNDRARARKLVEEAAEAAERTGSPWSRGRVARLRARLAIAEGRGAAARGHLEAALELFDAVPALLEVARTHTDAARAASGGNVGLDAREQLEAARAIYAANAPRRLAELGDLVARPVGTDSLATGDA